MEDVGEAIFAGIVSILAAGFTAILAVIACMFLGKFLFTLGLISDEGAAWSGLSLGIPVGLVCAIVVFVYCFRKIRALGQFVE
jgi:hypothetical protein